MNKYAAEMEKVAQEFGPLFPTRFVGGDDRRPAPLPTRAALAAIAGTGSAGMLYQMGESHPAWLASAAAVPAAIVLLSGQSPRPEHRRSIGEAAALGAAMGSIPPVLRPLLEKNVKFKGSRLAIGAAAGSALLGGGVYLANKASRDVYGG